MRALNAVKLERVFAKPFVSCLDGHKDGVSCIAKHPKQLSILASGAYDGEIRIWDLPQRVCTRSFTAHDGIIRGITYVPSGDKFISIGQDKLIKTWKSGKQDDEDEEPINTIISKTVITAISHHKKDPVFATCGEVCQIWEDTRNEPIKSFQWGVDSLHDIEFNKVETNILAACASDRSVILYDTRGTAPLRKVIMKLKSNKLAWNPMEAYTFTCANEDFK